MSMLNATTLSISMGIIDMGSKPVNGRGNDPGNKPGNVQGNRSGNEPGNKEIR